MLQKIIYECHQVAEGVFCPEEVGGEEEGGEAGEESQVDIRPGQQEQSPG